MFKKSGPVAILLISLVVSANCAFATDGPCGDQDEAGSILCATLLVSLSPIGTTIGLTGITTQQDRAVYVAQVRDDAAEYVAANGNVPPSAVLKSALQALRQNESGATQMNDLQLAKTLVVSQN